MSPVTFIPSLPLALGFEQLAATAGIFAAAILGIGFGDHVRDSQVTACGCQRENLGPEKDQQNKDRNETTSTKAIPQLTNSPL